MVWVWANENHAKYVFCCPSDLFPCAWNALTPVNLSWFLVIATFYSEKPFPSGGILSLPGAQQSLSLVKNSVRLNIRGRPLWSATDSILFNILIRG